MNFFNKIGDKIKLVLFNPNIPSSFSLEEKAKEQMAHKETERRHQIIEREEATRSLERAAEKTLEEMTPEEIKKAEEKRQQREETKPWGM